jgi:hypothetical protein
MAVYFPGSGPLEPDWEHQAHQALYRHSVDPLDYIMDVVAGLPEEFEVEENTGSRLCTNQTGLSPD